jgi:ribosome small subunit-dependent GTPase A
MLQIKGIIVAVASGLYEVRCDDGKVRRCRARGVFRYENITPLVGDRVTLEYGENAESDKTVKLTAKNKPDDITDGFVSEIDERRSALIRPPAANLDMIFITVAAAKPDPLALNIDKLTCIAEHNKITPVIIVTKRDLDPVGADALAAVYRLAGYSAFSVTVTEPSDTGMAELREFMENEGAGKITAFAGASGVGKSTLLGNIFPDLSPEVGELSRKIERGRHTTRSVTLYPVAGGGYIADTPGFSMLDFIRFDFMEAPDLELEFREFAPYLGKCRYTDCSHTKEEGCAVLEAMASGKISPSRHESYVTLRAELRSKNPWK